MSSTTLSRKSAEDPASRSSVERQEATNEPVNEYEDAEKNYNPKSLKFWSILGGMYLAMFLVALVRTSLHLLAWLQYLGPLQLLRALNKN